MDLSHRSGRLSLLSLTLCVTLSAIGCASPGPPKPPSLNLPELTRDLSAARIGDTVVLRFTVPSRSTDKLPLRGPNLTARFCRAVDNRTCQPIPASSVVVPLDHTAASTEHHTVFTWTDTLPSDLATGNPRPLRYSVELFNVSGRSAGASAPAFTAAGAAPAAVAGLRGEGSRLGVLLHWDDSSQSTGDLLLQRQRLSPPAPSNSGKPSPDTVQLMVPTSGPRPTSLLDTTAKPDTPYRYIATRRVTLQLGDRSIEMRGAPSAAVDLTLKAIYPPLAPTGLTAAGFTAATNPHTFAVDLVWQPVDDAGLITPLAGYNLYRAPADASAQPTRLNAAPLTLPAFRDTTASPNVRYRYTVTAIDVKGNESPATVVLLEP